MKAKVVKAYVVVGTHGISAVNTHHPTLPINEGFIVKCPHSWTITARPPRPKASKRKGGKAK